VNVRRAKEVRDLSPYGAVVVGISVHMGRTAGEARRFVSRHRKALSCVPVAYFVVCLTMAEDTPENRQTTLDYLEPLRRAAPDVEPVEIGLFAGAVLNDTQEFKRLFPFLKFVARAMSENTEDQRDWEAIRSWAEGVRPALIAERVG
jgi:menaquinone-dependent protoporphyrinogen oxidase